MNNPLFSSFPCRLITVVVLGFSCLAAAQTPATVANPLVGPGKIIVQPKFGGTIFGYDIDQNGSEGVLTEGQILGNGNILNAVETFDQKTGKIIKVVRKTETLDEDVTLGVVGTSVGLIEHDHVTGIYVTGRTYHMMNPLSGNKYTASWTPGLKYDQIIMGVSRNQGTPTNAFFVYDNVVNNPTNVVFASNVAQNTVGPKVKLNNVPQFSFGVPPVMAFDTNTNQAVLSQDYGSPTDVPVVGVADLIKGKLVTFNGVGLGLVNGIAVDSEDGIACSSTEIDFNIEFYDIKKQTGFTVPLAEANNQLNSGADVEFDPIHKLFLIAQPISTAGSSAIQVYDPKGNFVESLNGFNMPGDTVIPLHIALNPSNRSGYVDDVAGIRSFTY
jgi:hypothetical protein